VSKIFYRQAAVLQRTEANIVKVIPVVDVLGGVVVHAVRGRRREYQPLKSVLCASTDPLEVTAALKALGFGELYVADLDAIAGGHQNFSLLKKIAAKTGLELMVDAGVSSLEAAEELLDNGVSKVIIGTETLLSTAFVADAVASFGSEKVIVSLDLMGGRVLSRLQPDMGAEPMTLLRDFQDMDVSQIIVLDLAKVGSGEGVNKLFLKDVLREIEAEVFVGGGVRNVKDLLELNDVGVFGVLVATALHAGRISPEELKQNGLL
jgi:phosphoribosylformimino-5-aminoimidazole carboxamide ribotide isomerase